MLRNGLNVRSQAGKRACKAHWNQTDKVPLNYHCKGMSALEMCNTVDDIKLRLQRTKSRFTVTSVGLRMNPIKQVRNIRSCIWLGKKKKCIGSGLGRAVLMAVCMRKM